MKHVLYGNGSQQVFPLGSDGTLRLTTALPVGRVMVVETFKRRPKDAPCAEWRDEEWCVDCGGCAR